MRVFVTGATGFIGKAVVQELQGAGHVVVGLARTDAAAKALAAVGVEPHRGALDDPESLHRGAAAADGVIHLAFIHGLGGVRLGQRLGIFLGGPPSGIVSRFMAASVEADQRAIDAMGSALEGSRRPLVVTFGTMGLTPGRVGTEDDLPDPHAPGAARSAAESAVQAWASRGVRACVMRLPPTVHGDDDTGFVPQLIKIARKKRRASYAGDGSNRWGAVHRLDAAHLFRLVLERGEAGGRYHAVGDEGVPFRDIASVIGRRLDVPVTAATPQAFAAQLGWIGPFAATDNPSSSQLTQQRLGWRPEQPGLIADLDRASYFASGT